MGQHQEIQKVNLESPQCMLAMLAMVEDPDTCGVIVISGNR